jgi:hypothetical protein
MKGLDGSNLPRSAKQSAIFGILWRSPRMSRVCGISFYSPIPTRRIDQTASVDKVLDRSWPICKPPQFSAITTVVSHRESRVTLA